MNLFRVLRSACAVLALALLCSGLQTAAMAKGVVSGARAGEHDSKTRFVLDVSVPVQYKIFTLTDPYRVVIDLPEMDWTAPMGLGDKAVGAIDKLRYGLFSPDVGRIVLDLNRPVEVQSFLLSPRDGYLWRLVIDLVETSDTRMRAQPVPAEKVAAEPAPAPASAIAPQPETAPQPQPQPSARPVPLVLNAPQAAPVPQDAPAPAASATAVAQSPAAIVQARLTVPPPKPSLPKPRRPVIVIDAGHGGVDPGATGASGIYEKHITLAVARSLRDALSASGRFEVVMTRDRDIFIPLRERVAIARQASGDLFLSLHADAAAEKSLRGLSVYTLSETASDKEAAALAEKENKADLIAGMDLSTETPEVSNILIDLARRETMNLSARFAEDLIDEAGREVKLLRNTHRFAGFAVLKAPDVPSVLVELGYLSNGQEERLLRQEAYRAKLAQALARAIESWFAQNPVRNDPS